jgi:hypothetical protein
LVTDVLGNNQTQQQQQQQQQLQQHGLATATSTGLQTSLPAMLLVGDPSPAAPPLAATPHELELQQQQQQQSVSSSSLPPADADTTQLGAAAAAGVLTAGGVGATTANAVVGNPPLAMPNLLPMPPAMAPVPATATAASSDATASATAAAAAAVAIPGPCCPLPTPLILSQPLSLNSDQQQQQLQMSAQLLPGMFPGGVLPVGRVALPAACGVSEEPVYVNAKQYHCILRRRQQRAKQEQENRLVKARKVRGDLTHP